MILPDTCMELLGEQTATFHLFKIKLLVNNH